MPDDEQNLFALEFGTGLSITASVEHRGYLLGFCYLDGHKVFVSAWRKLGDTPYSYEWHHSYRMRSCDSEQAAIENARVYVDYLHVCKAMARVIGRPFKPEEFPPFKAPPFVVSIPALKRR